MTSSDPGGTAGGGGGGGGGGGRYYYYLEDLYPYLSDGAGAPSSSSSSSSPPWSEPRLLYCPHHHPDSYREEGNKSAADDDHLYCLLALHSQRQGGLRQQQQEQHQHLQQAAHRQVGPGNHGEGRAGGGRPSQYARPLPPTSGASSLAGPSSSPSSSLSSLSGHQPARQCRLRRSLLSMAYGVTMCTFLWIFLYTLSFSCCVGNSRLEAGADGAVAAGDRVWRGSRGEEEAGRVAREVLPADRGGAGALGHKRRPEHEEDDSIYTLPYDEADDLPPRPPPLQGNTYREGGGGERSAPEVRAYRREEDGEEAGEEEGGYMNDRRQQGQRERANRRYHHHHNHDEEHDLREHVGQEEEGEEEVRRGRDHFERDYNHAYHYRRRTGGGGGRYTGDIPTSDSSDNRKSIKYDTGKPPRRRGGGGSGSGGAGGGGGGGGGGRGGARRSRYRTDPATRTRQGFSRQLPKGLIIGVKKGGTRALLEFLRVHPDIRAPGPEPHFFDRNYDKGLEWYRSQMPPTMDSQLTLEKTPSYFVTKGVPGRIFNMSRSIKLIVVVRDPVTRAVSDYTQSTSKRSDVKPFEQMAFLDNATGLVDTSWGAIRIGVYAKHLERWLKYFPLSQMHFVSGERLISDPAAELAKVQDFLGLKRVITDKHFYFNSTKGFPCLKKPEGSSNPHCLGKTKGRPHPKVDPKVLKRLHDFYRPFNAKFYQMTNIDFGWP